MYSSPVNSDGFISGLFPNIALSSGKTSVMQLPVGVCRRGLDAIEAVPVVDPPEVVRLVPRPTRGANCSVSALARAMSMLTRFVTLVD